MDEYDKTLDEILSRRADAPPPASNLSARIIEAARVSAQHNATHMRTDGQGLRAWLGAFGRNFVLPQPAIAMSLVLMIGVGLGVFMQDVSGSSEEDMIFLYVENSFEVEDWL